MRRKLWCSREVNNLVKRCQIVHYKQISMLVSIYTVTWYDSFRDLVMQPCLKEVRTVLPLSMGSKNDKLLAYLFYKTTSISSNNFRILEIRTAFGSQIGGQGMVWVVFEPFRTWSEKLKKLKTLYGCNIQVSFRLSL